jgi:hypothetical protein
MFHEMIILASTASSTKAGASVWVWLLPLIGYLVTAAALWGIFVKAGEPGWAGLIPIYNTLVLLRVVGRPWWWLLLYLIPVVDLVVLVIVYYDLSKSFGHGVGFMIGLIFLVVIFLLILAFGASVYRGPAARAYVRAT